jgi:hypothetical protein
VKIGEPEAIQGLSHIAEQRLWFAVGQPFHLPDGPIRTPTRSPPQTYNHPPTISICLTRCIRTGSSCNRPKEVIMSGCICSRAAGLSGSSMSSTASMGPEFSPAIRLLERQHRDRRLVGQGQ